MSKKTQTLVNQLEARIEELTNELRQTHLMLDINQRFSRISTFHDVYDALAQSVKAIGADQCTLCMCEELDNNNLPIYGQIAFASNKKSSSHPNIERIGIEHRFPLAEYPTLYELVSTQETLVIENSKKDNRLAKEQETLQQFKANSIAINPLVIRAHVMGLLSIEYKIQYSFNKDDLALYRALASQTITAIEHVRQLQRTEEALAETQTLYRAGRVLAGAADLQEILQEALVEFVYSLGLDQGGITLLTTDRQFGQLMAYLEQGQLQDIEKLRFPIRNDIPYQQLLLAGQPFISYDLTNDPRLTEFHSFNTKDTTKSLLQAPIIVQGETIGWIGADAINTAREFTQREIDMARAMSDQIAIAIQNRRLLEQTEHQANQLRAVATVGEAVTGLIELDEVLNVTVNLIRDRFDFYHVSIFLLDEVREWAVVRASTGNVGKIMVERPHRLGVGSNSIVGFVTANAQPRIALDVGKEKVYFDNPLLPKTRSEMALPLISRGTVIGALDVQSVEANAFTADDIETLQIMADQLVTAIDNARLFEQTQRRLIEQAMLYRIGTKIGGTLNLQETTKIIITETAESLNTAECALLLLEENDTIYVIGDYVKENSNFKSYQGKRFPTKDLANLLKIKTTKQEIVVHIDDPKASGWELEYLKTHHGTAMATVPILLRNDVIGLLEVYDDKPDRHFTQEDIALLDSIALQAANAIENARLFETAHESQAFMKAIINQIPDPIFIKDREHRWVVVNTAFSEGILGHPEEDILGHSDYDFLPKEEADWFWEQDHKMFETGKIQETEEPIADADGNMRTLYTRKIPLTLTQDESKPEYLIGIINDITERKQQEAERERLIEQTQKTLDRTQTLYRISDTLAAATEPALSKTKGQQATFEAVLGEYLQLLGSKQGSIMLFDKTTNTNVAQARYVEGQTVEPNLVLPVEQDLVFQHLQKKPKSFIIEDAKNHPLTKKHKKTRAQRNVTSMLFIPLLTRGQLAGNIVVDATSDHVFTQGDIEIGEAIADQLNIWLENRQLLTESQYRSERLQTAAEVSQAASSILDVDKLINTSVNFIRNRFNFYYVGLFMVDEARKWAVLRAGTGEAGRIQLKNKHRLEIGGESMIGWSVSNRKARIALDVGKEAVRFKNPILPDTHSEMALPLISRDEVIGALTVQSVERGAFSDEDITLLQTMADQLANAIANAFLFTQTQEALAEAETLSKLTQELSSAHDEDIVYQLAMDAIAGSGIDTSAIYMYLNAASQNTSVISDNAGISEQLIEQKAVWTATGKSAVANGTCFRATDFVIEQLVPHHGLMLIEDVDKANITDQLRRTLKRLGITSLVVLPLSAYQNRLGFLLAAYTSKDKKFTPNQTRFFTTIAQQMVIALENLRLLDASQRRARREEIIREITSKIRNAVNIDDILKTTVTELSKVVGTSRGSITLGVTPLPTKAQTPPQDSNGDQSSATGDDNLAKNRVNAKESIGDKESESHGQ